MPPIGDDAALRSILADPALSYTAKGVLVFVLSRPPGAVITRAELLASGRDPTAAIDAAVRELAQAGLVPASRTAGRGVIRRSGPGRGVCLNEAAGRG